MTNLLCIATAFKLAQIIPIVSTHPCQNLLQPLPRARESTPTEVTSRPIFDKCSRRNSTGVSRASCALPTHSTLLWGTDQNAGYITREISASLEGRKFNDFGKFRKALWKSVARSGHLGEFSLENQERMQLGRAPLAPESQQRGDRVFYEIHHITPLHQGGATYDPCNLMIVTPRYHEEVLTKEFHFVSDKSKANRNRTVVELK